MKQRTEILGGHALFFPEGKALAGGDPANLASRSNKPNVADPGWFNLGIIDIKFQPTREEHEVWAPAPGKKQLEDVISYKRGLAFAIHVKELSNLFWQILLGLAPLPDSPAAGGQFVCLEGDDVRGWLKVQMYGRNDQLLMVHDGYVYMAPSDLDPGDGPAEGDVTARLLRSALNTGDLK